MSIILFSKSFAAGIIVCIEVEEESENNNNKNIFLKKTSHGR